MSASRRILLINPFGIGDVLFTTPLIRALRCAFPQGFLGYLCNRRTESVLRENPHLDELFIYEKDEFVALWRRARERGLREFAHLLQRIRRARFDLVVDLSLGERYSFILKWLGLRRRAGFDYRRRGRFLTERLEINGYQDAHVVEYYRRLLHFLGVSLVDASLELRVSAQDQQWADRWLAERGLQGHQLLVGIVPAGGVSWGIDAPFRRWSFEGFAAVGDALAQRRGARIILFGEAADVTVCHTVAQLMRHRPIDLSGGTTLGQFVGLMSRLSLVVCNDGGPLHLAVSQGVKTVSVFGPVDPRVYGPYPAASEQHRVICRHDLPCRPCYHQFKLPPCPYERACLTTVTSADVLEACEAMVAGQPALSPESVRHGPS